MKFSTFIIIVLLAVIAYALLNPRTPAPAGGTTAPVIDIEKIAKIASLFKNEKTSTPPDTEMTLPLPAGAEPGPILAPWRENKERAKSGPPTRVDATAPVPEVHATKTTTVRGLVIGIEDQFAVVDCAYKVKLSEEELASLRRNGNPHLISLLQQEEENKVFGALKIVNERGQLSGVEIKPRQSANGKVYLTGLPLRAGDFVHVISAPIGQHPSGMPVYAARLKLMGGAWMWNSQGGGTLDPPRR